MGHAERTGGRAQVAVGTRHGRLEQDALYIIDADFVFLYIIKKRFDSPFILFQQAAILGQTGKPRFASIDGNLRKNIGQIDPSPFLRQDDAALN